MAAVNAGTMTTEQMITASRQAGTISLRRFAAW